MYRRCWRIYLIYVYTRAHCTLFYNIWMDTNHIHLLAFNIVSSIWLYPDKFISCWWRTSACTSYTAFHPRVFFIARGSDWLRESNRKQLAFWLAPTPVFRSRPIKHSKWPLEWPLEWPLTFKWEIWSVFHTDIYTNSYHFCADVCVRRMSTVRWDIPKLVSKKSERSRLRYVLVYACIYISFISILRVCLVWSMLLRRGVSV